MGKIDTNDHTEYSDSTDTLRPHTIVRDRGELVAVVRGQMNPLEGQRGCSAWRPEGGA